MKQAVKAIVIFIISAFLLPLCVYCINAALNKEQTKEKSASKETISVYFHKEDAVKELPLDEYLKGVVCAEVPASFEKEAIKAQAVAARSYALYRAESVQQAHPEAAVCTDFNHCKAYKTLEEAKSGWGGNADLYENKISVCVEETKDEVIKYNGEVALAVFHSQSGGGKTESSGDVWGGNLPYLVSVESIGDEKAPNFYSSKEISFEEFKSIIENENKNAKVNSFGDISSVAFSDGGRVKSIIIGGQTFSGTKIRSLFSLRSTSFTIKENNGNILFEVTGYGHGVGMSQYGANEMAKRGYNYKEILEHYYSGTQIDYV